MSQVAKKMSQVAKKMSQVAKKKSETLNCKSSIKLFYLTAVSDWKTLKYLNVVETVLLGHLFSFSRNPLIQPIVFVVKIIETRDGFPLKNAKLIFLSKPSNFPKGSSSVKTLKSLLPSS